MKSWKVWVGFAVTIVIAAAGIWAAYMWWLADPLTEGGDGQMVPVQRGRLVVTVKALGSVAVPPKQVLDFGIAGRLRELHVTEGQVVEAGAVLASLDTAGLELQVDQAEAALALSQARLAHTQAPANKADLEAAIASLAAAEAKYEQVKAGPLPAEIASAEAALRSAELSRDQLLAGPSGDELTLLKANVEKAEIARRQAQGEYDRYAWRQGFEASTQAAALQKATIDFQQASASYNLAMAGPTIDQLAKGEAQITQARAQLDRLQDTGAGGELKSAAAQVARARAEIELLEGSPTPEEVAIAQAQVEQARISLEQAERKVGHATLVAPSGGTVVSVRANVGQSVSAGTPIVILADLSGLQVKAGIHETHVAKVKRGQRVTIYLDAFPNQRLEGRVGEIAPLATVTAGAISYEAIIGLLSSELPVKPGMVARVEITTSHKEDALIVPKGALRLQDGAWTVRALRDGHLVDTEVQIGERSGRAVEVLAGLAEGEQVLMKTAPLSVEQQDARFLPSGIGLEG